VLVVIVLTEVTVDLVVLVLDAGGPGGGKNLSAAPMHGSVYKRCLPGKKKGSRIVASH